MIKILKSLPFPHKEGDVKCISNKYTPVPFQITTPGLGNSSYEELHFLYDDSIEIVAVLPSSVLSSFHINLYTRNKWVY